MSIYMKSDYSLNTLGAKLCLEAAWDLVEKSIGAIASPASIVMADYGVADGGTPSGLWQRILQKLRNKNPQTPIQLIFNDLPSNNYNALAQQASHFMEMNSDVWVSMVPQSFYQTVCSPNQIDFGFSSTAMHWLSQRPHHLAQHTHINAWNKPEDKVAFQAQSAADWTTILLARAQELKAGGQFVGVNLSTDAEGRYLGQNFVDQNMHDVLHNIWKEMLSKGLIQSQEYINATFQNYYRTEAEFTVCLQDPQSEVYQAGLRLGEIRTQHIPCPYRQQYNQDGNIDQFAKGLTETIRSWSEHTFRAALENRSEVESSHLLNHFYSQFEEQVKLHPNEYSMDYIETYIRIYKV